MTRFYCFINGKIKKESKNLELDVNVAKMGNSTFFRSKQQILQQMNSVVQRENPHAAEYWWPWSSASQRPSKVPSNFVSGHVDIVIGLIYATLAEL